MQELTQRLSDLLPLLIGLGMASLVVTLGIIAARKAGRGLRRLTGSNKSLLHRPGDDVHTAISAPPTTTSASVEALPKAATEKTTAGEPPVFSAAAAIDTFIPHERANATPAAVERLVEQAKTSRDPKLPALYLHLAKSRMAAGHHQKAKDALRLAVQSATVQGQKSIHAIARMALAEAAVADGDATTACEHWQIARLLFHEIGASGEYEQADHLMRKNGCPTDWVLTDF